MNIIGNKMFAYIDNHNELTQPMINEYNSSLIFLGDEKQIFVPLINAYVGLGTSAYTYLLNKITEGNSNLNAFNEYIHKDSVTSIYTQFAPNEIEEAIERGNGQNINLRGKLINNDSAYTYFKANRNVIIKGLNQVDDLNNTVNNVRSGIDINIKHVGEKQEIIYNGVSYSYYAPYDIITIDDTKTWSYITNSNTYMTEFVTKFATQQANRVYKNILGEANEYIEKSFNEAFLYDEVTGTLNIIKPVYVKKNTNYSNVTLNYSEVTVENTADGYRIKTTIDGTQYIVYSTIAGDTVANLSNILADENNDGLYGGYHENADTHQLIPYWYNLENTGTEGNKNIADGIQTLREVAYILDRITDGAGAGDEDDGIQLAYNIAWNHDEIIKLKRWQDDIGNQTVSSFKSDSNTDLLTVNYYSTNLWDKDGNNGDGAIGHVELDLDLKLAQTYEINGVSYAAYYNGQPGITRETYIITDNDITNIKNYICLTDSTKNGSYDDLINYIKSFPGWDENSPVRMYTLTRDPNNSNIITGRQEYGDTTNGISVSSLSYQSANDVYIWFPHKLVNYQFDQGLTNVKWVTSYVRSTHEDLVNKITTTDSDIRQLINQTITGLAYTDIDKSSEGQFVTQVNEVNGVISVNRTKLPLDHILQNDIFYTEYSYIHIDTASIPNDPNDRSNIYQLHNGKYEPISIQTNLTDTIHDDIYYRMSLASMISVPAGTTVETLLTNAGGVSYFYKEQNKNSGVVSYLPLDIQKEITSGELLADSEVATDNTIYYLNSSASISNIKYFDLSTIQMNNGSTTTIFTTYITYLAAASYTNSGLADAWDVRRTIESMFQWVNVKTNTLIL